MFELETTQITRGEILMRYAGKWTLCYGAGCLGGLATALFIWFLGALDVTESYGVRIAPDLTPAWIYSMVVWGGIYGLLFSIPAYESHYVLRGAAYSLVPTLIQLFLVYPIMLKKGIMGTYLGENTYLFVVGFNLVWGAVTSMWLKLIKG